MSADEIFSLLNDEDALQAQIEQIRALTVDPPADGQPCNVVDDSESTRARQRREFDAAHNLLNIVVRDGFVQTRLFTPADTNIHALSDNVPLFTAPQSTTNTACGMLSNVQFHERDLIQDLLPTHDFLVFHSNYGRYKYEGYDEPPTHASKRAARVVRKPRKKQGEGAYKGTTFNSQITIIMRSTLEPVIYCSCGGFYDATGNARASANDDQSNIAGSTRASTDTTLDPHDPGACERCIPRVPANAKIYKFKLFRTGKIQLPGVKQQLVGDVLSCVNKIVDLLNMSLHFGETDPRALVQLININPTMKNYKFTINLAGIAPHTVPALANSAHTSEPAADTPAGAELEPSQKAGPCVAQCTTQLMCDLIAFRDAVLAVPPAAWPGERAYVKYDRQDTKLSVVFITPIPGNPHKKTRVSIFMRGKVNILGGFCVDTTRAICMFLCDVLRRNLHAIVVPEIV